MALKNDITVVTPVIRSYNMTHRSSAVAEDWLYEIEFTFDVGLIYKGLTKPAAFGYIGSTTYDYTASTVSSQKQSASLRRLDGGTHLQLDFVRTTSINAIRPQDTGPGYDVDVQINTAVTVPWRGNPAGGGSVAAPTFSPEPEATTFPDDITITRASGFSGTTRYFVYDLFGVLGNSQGFTHTSGDTFAGASSTITLTKPSIVIAYSMTSTTQTSASSVAVYND